MRQLGVCPARIVITAAFLRKKACTASLRVKHGGANFNLLP